MEDEIEIPVQIMGRVRARITMVRGASSTATEAAALKNEQIKGHLEGKTVRKWIIVPDKIVNIITD